MNKVDRERVILYAMAQQRLLKQQMHIGIILREVIRIVFMYSLQ